MARVSRIRPGDEVFVDGYWAKVSHVDVNHRVHVVGCTHAWSAVVKGRQIQAVQREGKRVIA